MKPKPSSMGSLRELEEKRRQVILLEYALGWALLFLGLGMMGNLIHSALKVREPIAPLIPPLEELQLSLPKIPAVSFPAELFVAAKPVAATEGGEVAEKISWKLKGVLLTPNKRAFLESEDGQISGWVGEGESIGSVKVREIRQRSVIVETGGKSREVRM